jgi:predicted nucleotidyltransferase
VHLEPDEQKIVLSVLDRIIPGREVWVFGSRAHGTNLKPYSDLDLALPAPQPLSLETLVDLREAFRESDLPFRVDIVERGYTDKAFWRIVERDHEVLAPAGVK